MNKQGITNKLMVRCHIHYGIGWSYDSSNHYLALGEKQNNSIQFNSIQLYSHKTLQQNTSGKIYTTKSYGGVGWKANEA